MQQVRQKEKPVHRLPKRLAEGGGSGAEMEGEVLRGDIRVDANTQHQRRTSAGQRLQLSEYARDLPALQAQVVGPLNPYGNIGHVLDPLRKGHR